MITTIPSMRSLNRKIRSLQPPYLAVDGEYDDELSAGSLYMAVVTRNQMKDGGHAGKDEKFQYLYSSLFEHSERGRRQIETWGVGHLANQMAVTGPP